MRCVPGPGISAQHPGSLVAEVSPIRFQGRPQQAAFPLHVTCVVLVNFVHVTRKHPRVESCFPWARGAIPMDSVAPRGSGPSPAWHGCRGRVGGPPPAPGRPPAESQPWHGSTFFSVPRAPAAADAEMKSDNIPDVPRAGTPGHSSPGGSAASAQAGHCPLGSSRLPQARTRPPGKPGGAAPGAEVASVGSAPLLLPLPPTPHPEGRAHSFLPRAGSSALGVPGCLIWGLGTGCWDGVVASPAEAGRAVSTPGCCEPPHPPRAGT